MRTRVVKERAGANADAAHVVADDEHFRALGDNLKAWAESAGSGPNGAEREAGELTFDTHHLIRCDTVFASSGTSAWTKTKHKYVSHIYTQNKCNRVELTL
jgi:hypothetical protein